MIGNRPLTNEEPHGLDEIGQERGIAPYRAGLDVLDEPRTFAPKAIFPIVWGFTGLAAIGGSIISLANDVTPWIWGIALLVAFRQLWIARRVQVDADGIRTRNILGRGRAIRWPDIDEVEEREIPLRSGRFFGIIKIHGTAEFPPHGKTVIELDSDLRGFAVLREIVRGEAGSS